MDTISQNLAANLRQIRAEERLSLDELAERTGVSKSMLRQIENGDSSPTIATVWKIANGLKRSFTSLIDAEDSRVEVANFLTNQQMTAAGGAYRLYPIYAFDPKQGFELYYVEIDPNADLSSDGHNNAAIETVVMHAGQLTLTIGSETKTLAPGHAIRFNATGPHHYHNTGTDTCKLYMIISYGVKG